MRNLDLYLADCEDLKMIRVFNKASSNEHEGSLRIHKLSNLVTELTWYENSENPSYIDLILTNCPQSFHTSCVIETSTSHFHRVTVSTMKSNFQKLKQRLRFIEIFGIFLMKDLKNI